MAELGRTELHNLEACRKQGPGALPLYSAAVTTRVQMMLLTVIKTKTQNLMHTMKPPHFSDAAKVL